MLLLSNRSIIYILSPGNISSGGPEALHQLHYYLKKLKYSSYLCYYTNPITPENYKKYNPSIKEISEIEDSIDHVIISPEIATKELKKFNSIRKCIWWLGVQYYDGFETMPNNNMAKLKHKLIDFLPNQILELRQNFLKIFYPNLYKKQPYIISKKDIVLCGSKFAYDYTVKRFKNVFMFVEPLGLEFLNLKKINLISDGRSNKILYNPAKNSIIMETLLKRKDLEFLPIMGFNENQLIYLFQRSKIYIDFGMFGGPERIPKETVLNGTLLLVGKKNAAINDFDIAIPNKYKIDTSEDEEEIVKKIKYMIANYEDLICDFESFRLKIKNLEKIFLDSIQDIFKIQK